MFVTDDKHVSNNNIICTTKKWKNSYYIYNFNEITHAQYLILKPILYRICDQPPSSQVCYYIHDSIIYHFLKLTLQFRFTLQCRQRDGKHLQHIISCPIGLFDQQFYYLANTRLIILELHLTYLSCSIIITLIWLGKVLSLSL